MKFEWHSVHESSLHFAWSISRSCVLWMLWVATQIPSKPSARSGDNWELTAESPSGNCSRLKTAALTKVIFLTRVVHTQRMLSVWVKVAFKRPNPIASLKSTLQVYSNFRARRGMTEALLQLNHTASSPLPISAFFTSPQLSFREHFPVNLLHANLPRVSFLGNCPATLQCGFFLKAPTPCLFLPHLQTEDLEHTHLSLTGFTGWE